MRDLVAHPAPELLERCIALVGEDPFPRVAESTRFAQPAIFCASLVARVLFGQPAGAAAGHSLGELAARAAPGPALGAAAPLTAAGVLDRDAALELVVTRGRLMRGDVPDGTMLAV